jgi:hypothetical protein
VILNRFERHGLVNMSGDTYSLRGVHAE